ncbi:unnamed protein product [Rotaria sp. Silwood1]|nr:unnamed protein product [Rotaria sp. Silwood1]CAF1612134.1 unnamed protein product [Rotaria sp. Silwood1]CAF3730765.1 unnamed protein product [Rotaria sp. Silwood1]
MQMENSKSDSILPVYNDMASVKLEVEKPTYDRYILDENNIFIPDRYLTRMAHNGLLEKFIDLVAAVNIETENFNCNLFKLKREHEATYDDVELKRIKVDNDDEPLAADISNNETDQCHREMTLQEIKILLKLHPCVNLGKSFATGRMKRQLDAGRVDVYALQTTVNDHRTMINYLINNSINATYVSGAISDHHSKSFPILTSWRDIIDVIFIIIFIGFIMHFLLARAGLSPCKTCFSYFSKCVFPNIDEQLQQQQQLQQQLQQQQTLLQQLQGQLRHQDQEQTQQEINKNYSIRRKQQHVPTIATLHNDIAPFQSGYMSD